MHNQHALPGLLYTQERKKKTQMPSENCLSGGNIDRPLITVAHHVPPDATAQFLGPANNSGDGEGSSGQPGGSRFSRSPPHLNTLPSVLLLHPSGCLSLPIPVYVGELPKSKAGSQGPFCMDAHSSTPRNTQVPWRQRRILK